VPDLPDEIRKEDDRPGDPKGPNLGDWSDIPGMYSTQAPFALFGWTVFRYNGYIYAYYGGIPMRLTEIHWHVFSQPDGIVWEFNGNEVIVGGIRCEKH